MPEVSVVIPTFNRAHLIVESVQSVLRQTFDDLEVIVVDDCSTDDTVELLAQIEDPRVRVIRHERNSGAGAARNTGIRAATGTYVAFQDSDDEWLPTKLAKQLALLKAKPADWVAVYCGMLIVKDINQEAGTRTRVRYIPDSRSPALEGDITRPLIANSFISTQTLVARRDVLASVGEFDEALPALEDWDYTLRIAQVGKVAFVDEPLVLQRFSADSITRSEPKRMAAYVKILDKMRGSGILSNDQLLHHYYSVSGGYRNIGEYASSMSYLIRCISSNPLHVGYWFSLCYAALLSVLHKMFGMRAKYQ